MTMSNHAIGYDLGNVLKGIMKLYDSKELSENAVFKICDMLFEVLDNEDGNEGEMLKKFNKTRCGVCLRKYQSKEQIFLIDYDSKYLNNYENWDVPKISSCFCRQCLNKLKENQNLPDSFEEDLKKEMNESYDSDEWLAG